MPQLSTETDSEGRSISERDLGKIRHERDGRETTCTPELAAAHQQRAKPILDEIGKLSSLSPRVTSQCRVNSAAHYWDAVDVAAPDPYAVAAGLSRGLGERYFVQVEEALPGNKQKNTAYLRGAAQRSSIQDRAQSFTGTHVHVQTAREFRQPPRRDR